MNDDERVNGQTIERERKRLLIRDYVFGVLYTVVLSGLGWLALYGFHLMENGHEAAGNAMVVISGGVLMWLAVRF